MNDSRQGWLVFTFLSLFPASPTITLSYRTEHISQFSPGSIYTDRYTKLDRNRITGHRIPFPLALLLSHKQRPNRTR
ncbi:hypothetical protein B0H65DRAFT_58583 [Neurospora tetraspora]|uniref:Secreted peptide n=1 Tax=Neurospora tetraspora TaxID=94610 RepID=A0AAE0JQA1_9PEZI|nr:hypothetical protein B0H65DRAFT_58583 [Neurospora tetraspora]